MWVFVAAAQLGAVYILPGIWPAVPVLSLIAMIAAVTRAYQDAERLRTPEEPQPPP